MSTVILIIFIIAIFISFYLSKCRFGIFGLSLAAGFILSEVWNYEAGLIVSALSIKIDPIVNSIITIVICLLPAYLLIFNGRKNKTKIGRLMSSFVFTILVLGLLIEPLETIFVFQGLAYDIYDKIFAVKDLIIGVGLIIAVLDLFFTKPIVQTNKKRGR